MFILPDRIDCGYFDCSEFEGLSVSPGRLIPRFEIELYLEDGKTTARDGVTYPIRKNHILISRPGQTAKSVLPFYTVFLRFDARDELAETLSSMPPFFPLSSPNAAKSKIDEMILCGEKGDRLSQGGAFLSFLGTMVHDAGQPRETGGREREIIAAAEKFMEDNLSRPIRLCDIAASVHLSEIWFHTVFTKGKGITPHACLVSLRVEAAKKLLWDAKVPIGTVAERSGFGCQQNLNKVFKRETGMSPGEYRKLFREKYWQS